LHAVYFLSLVLGFEIIATTEVVVDTAVETVEETVE